MSGEQLVRQIQSEQDECKAVCSIRDENEQLRSLLKGAVRLLKHEVFPVNYKIDKTIDVLTEKAERILK